MLHHSYTESVELEFMKVEKEMVFIRFSGQRKWKTLFVLKEKITFANLC